MGIRLPGPVDPSKVQVLVYGDSLCCRATLAAPNRTCIGKYFPGGIGRPEYGHLECAHFFGDEPVEVDYYAVSGMRLAAPGSPSAADVKAEIYNAFKRDPQHR